MLFNAYTFYLHFNTMETNVIFSLWHEISTFHWSLANNNYGIGDGGIFKFSYLWL